MRSYSLLSISSPELPVFPLPRLQTAIQEVKKIAELFHLFRIEGPLEQIPVGAREFGIELAIQLTALSAQSHQHSAAIIARRDSLDQPSSFEPVQYPRDTALGDQGFVRNFRTAEALGLGPGERPQHVYLRHSEIEGLVRTQRMVGEQKPGLQQRSGSPGGRAVGGLDY